MKPDVRHFVMGENSHGREVPEYVAGEDDFCRPSVAEWGQDDPTGYKSMWAPLVMSWFKGPSNYSYNIGTIKHSYCSYKPTERSLGGPTLYYI